SIFTHFGNNICGGYPDPSQSTLPMKNNNAVALLSTQNFEDFTWSLPAISNQPIPYWHTAITYRKKMRRPA
ncbi:4802_t:CDS:1, partial [Ambispora gerdemannii]